MTISRLGGIAGVIALTLAAAAAIEEQTLRIPSMPEWKLLRRVDPVYPRAAVRAHIQGKVRFTATIGTDGQVERLRLINGHPLLVPAARDAVKRWVYRPTLSGGSPVRVITVIEVDFWLDPYGNPRNLAESANDSAT